MDKQDRRITKLADALRRNGGTHTVEDIVEACRRGEMQAFWNDDAVIVTEIATTPRKRFLIIFLAGGTLEGCLALRSTLVNFARANGIDTARSYVRPGFAKVLKKHGWRPRSVGVEFTLEA